MLTDKRVHHSKREPNENDSQHNSKGGAVTLVPGSVAAAEVQAASPLTRPTFNVLHAFEEPASGLACPSVIPSGDGGYVGLAVVGAFCAGMVYKLAEDGSVTTLYNFTGGDEVGTPSTKWGRTVELAA